MNKKLPGAHWYSYVFLYGILKPLLFVYFHVFQRIRFSKNGFKIPKGPIFVIGNHHTNWDGFYHAILLYWRFPHFIVHDEAFKNDTYSKIFGSFLGQIRRGRNGLSAEPIKVLKQLVDSGQSVSVLPEGDIDMFGRTLPIDQSIAKLARLLNIPVVLIRISGAHLRAPRWSNLAHHTHIDVKVTDVILPKQLSTLELATLYQRIIDGVKINSYDIQAKANRKVSGNRRGEWLELGLYWCPRCQQFETLTSRGNDFICRTCGLFGTVNNRLRLDVTDYPHLARPDIWDEYQLAALKQKLDQSDHDEHLFSLSDGKFECVEIHQFFNNNGQKVNARLYKDRLEVDTINKMQIIKLESIKRVGLQYKDVFEICDDKFRYRLYRKTPKWSAYLWVNCVKELTKL